MADRKVRKRHHAEHAEPTSYTVPTACLDEKVESKELEKTLRNTPGVRIRWSGEKTPKNPDSPALLTSVGTLTDVKDIKKWAEKRAKETKETKKG